MRAAVFGGPGRVEVQEVPVPEVDPDQVLVMGAGPIGPLTLQCEPINLPIRAMWTEGGKR